jgi:hypothetical protein
MDKFFFKSKKKIIAEGKWQKETYFFATDYTDYTDFILFLD